LRGVEVRQKLGDCFFIVLAFLQERCKLDQVADTLTVELLYRTRSKVRDVDKRRLIKPLSLYEHLQQMNQVHRHFQESFLGGNVDHALDNTDRLVQDGLGVGDEVSNR